MSEFMRSTGQAELLPVVAEALIANGYTMDLSLEAHFSDTTALVMRCGTTTVLLAHAPNSTVDDIEVWGAGQRATADVFEIIADRAAQAAAAPFCTAVALAGSSQCRIGG